MPEALANIQANRARQRIIQTERRQEAFERAERERLAGIYEDETSWLAETLNGEMTSAYSFPLKHGELYAVEQMPGDTSVTHRHLRTMYEDGVGGAREHAGRDPRFRFEIERARHYIDELDMMEGMAKGELPNTMMVFEPFPDELADETATDIDGYKPRDRRSMMRVITADDRSGEVTVTSQSLDTTDRAAIAAVYAAMGEELPADSSSNDIVAQRVCRDLPPQWQKELPGNLRAAWDGSLQARFGGEWHAGRRQQEGNTWEFVLAQDDLLRHHLAEIAPLVGLAKNGDTHARTMLKNARYQAAALMKQRYSGQQTASGNISADLSDAGAEAVAKGESFGGCGLNVSAEQQLSELGYAQGKNGELAGGCRLCQQGVSHRHECENCPLCKTKNVTAWYTRKTITCESGCGKTLHKATGKVTGGAEAAQPGTFFEIIEAIMEENRRKKAMAVRQRE